MPRHRSPPDAAPTPYTVRAGDTLFSIAQRFNMTLEQIQSSGDEPLLQGLRQLNQTAMKEGMAAQVVSPATAPVVVTEPTTLAIEFGLRGWS